MAHSASVITTTYLRDEDIDQILKPLNNFIMDGGRKIIICPIASNNKELYDELAKIQADHEGNYSIVIPYKKDNYNIDAIILHVAENGNDADIVYLVTTSWLFPQSEMMYQVSSRRGLRCQITQSTFNQIKGQKEIVLNGIQYGRWDDLQWQEIRDVKQPTPENLELAKQKIITKLSSIELVGKYNIGSLQIAQPFLCGKNMGSGQAVIIAILIHLIYQDVSLKLFSDKDQSGLNMAIGAINMLHELNGAAITKEDFDNEIKFRLGNMPEAEAGPKFTDIVITKQKEEGNFISAEDMPPKLTKNNKETEQDDSTRSVRRRTVSCPPRINNSIAQPISVLSKKSTTGEKFWPNILLIFTLSIIGSGMTLTSVLAENKIITNISLVTGIVFYLLSLACLLLWQIFECPLLPVSSGKITKLDPSCGKSVQHIK